MRVTDSGIAGNRHFPVTSWSVIVQLQDAASPEYARHLGRLVELYWKPVYSVIRHGWRRTHEDAKDLTQDFFATVVFDRDLLRAFAPERGSFRALLRTALGRFLHDDHKSAGRLKRGGGVTPLPLDVIGGEPVEAVPDAAALTPEQIFDAAWNDAVLREAFALLQQRLGAEGKATAFDVFRRYDVEGDGAELSYGELAAELSLTPSQVKHALKEARDAFREVVTSLVRGYVDDAADMTSELRRLFGA